MRHEEVDEEQEDSELFDHKLIEPILPCKDVNNEKGLASMESHPAIRIAMDESLQLGGENQVHIVHDIDLDEDVLELLGGETRIVISTNNIMRYLVFFAKNLDAFFTFEIEVLDEKKEYRTLTITNARSLARVNASHVQMPLAFGKGWQYFYVDLQSVVHDAFGTQHVATVQLRLMASCRLLRVFFQDVKYSYAELPLDLAILD
ncbi:hypothetical protein THRCLA_10705 [Thraustotheca clavata]|uniref:CFA20 domain-containing protein n=1 Tax=Thraustotheca clavata TaxID=74557 RepID=A0A1V9YI48_9STRA|nr:hypothetical protein THRCLA_10705 [Thraustotheca clavata]